MALKAAMDRPAMNHGQAVKGLKGEVRYNSFKDATQEIPELLMAEDLITGFLKGSSFGGASQCNDAMQMVVFYAFEIVKNRQVYEPSKIMKVGIAFQKLQEKTSLFYA